MFSGPPALKFQPGGFQAGGHEWLELHDARGHARAQAPRVILKNAPWMKIIWIKLAEIRSNQKKPKNLGNMDKHQGLN